ncbi:hypothetical protein GGS26DRAFT_85660 [Hypomontagnella submonticulosa]|nr:hypothetical protein GGS26DRAFT_85660 [Hypomontagnella submonticulosa]
MRVRQILTSLIAPTAVLSLPTSLSTDGALSSRASAQNCTLIKFPNAPVNPGPCWAWYAPTSTPADYCGGSTFNSVASATSSSSSWLDSCASLRATQLGAQRDFFLADYATDKYNTLLQSGGCALQVQPATPPSSEQVYMGGTDVADILGSATAASRAAGGKVGIEGSMTCSPGVVRWRMVPI